MTVSSFSYFNAAFVNQRISFREHRHKCTFEIFCSVSYLNMWIIIILSKNCPPWLFSLQLFLKCSTISGYPVLNNRYGWRYGRLVISLTTCVHYHVSLFAPYEQISIWHVVIFFFLGCQWPEMYNKDYLPLFQPLGNAAMNTRVFKEPRGFMRCVQWFFAIVAFGCCCDFSTHVDYTVECTAPDNTSHKVTHVFSYPFQ